MVPENTKTKHLNYWLLSGPCATVFVSGFFIMTLELLAGRIVAYQLGSSLYTWTSVILVVLSGITLGNYIGGRVADRFKTENSIPALFVLCSVGCVVTIIAINLITLWPWLWQFSWAVRVFLHVFFVFLVPSALLGMISPIVTKATLDRGLETGRTIGVIYACSTAGNIAGTFVTGFFLIAAAGTATIIWIASAIMLIVAMLYRPGSRLVRTWAVLLVFLLIVGNSYSPRLSRIKSFLGLTYPTDSGIIYEDDTQYCHITVKRREGKPELRIFIQDALEHSIISMDEPLNLQYQYSRIMAAVTHRFAGDRINPGFLILGGGGYVIPRYLRHYWPNSRIDVVEIDPGVTHAAQMAFGLEPTTKINTISLDARNYVDQVLSHGYSATNVVKYDFIYEDAINHYNVPFQLTTREFNDKLAKLLVDDGIYMVTLIDRLDSALFLSSIVNTMRQTFAYVTVITEANIDLHNRNTFVVIAAPRPLTLDEKLFNEYDGCSYQILNVDNLTQINGRPAHVILTDDYAPVENLLAPAAATSAYDGYAMLAEIKSRKIAAQAEKLAWAGDLKGTLAKTEALIAFNPAQAARAYTVMARIFAGSNRIPQAIQIYETAIKKNLDQKGVKADLIDLHYDWGMLLLKTGNEQQGIEHLQLSANICLELLLDDPNSGKIHARLGTFSAILGDFAKAVVHFKKAVDLEPDNTENYFYLIRALETQGLLDESIERANASIQFFNDIGRKDEAAKMLEYLRHLEQKKPGEK